MKFSYVIWIQFLYNKYVMVGGVTIIIIDADILWHVFDKNLKWNISNLPKYLTVTN